MTEDEVVEGLRARALREGWLPPATDDAVVEAERTMQVRLPSLLRRIYVEVANGGFGPRGDILGLRGGYSDSGEDVDLVECNTPTDAEHGNLVAGDEYENSAGELVHVDAVPLGMIFLMNWGCAIWSVLDCREPGGVMWGWLEGTLCCQDISLMDWLGAYVDGAEDELMPDYRGGSNA
jgi:hypothetical protein